jgi:hypothetical protein
MLGWLVHPLPLAAIALTALNDHVLKGSGLLPGWLTGKLSDFTGLFFFPLVVAAVVRAKTPAARAAVVIAVGALFAGLKLSPAACAWIAPLAGVTPDPTDLVALPVLALAWLWMARWRPSPRWNGLPWTRFVALGAAAVTSAATSPSPGPYYYRPLPMWSAAGVTRQPLACADVELWVSKSGRQGVGLTIAFEPRGAPCALRLDGVALIIPGAGEHAATALPARVDLAPDQPAYRYVPLPFDNAAAWNGHHRAGFVRVDVTAPDGAHALRFDVVQAQAPRPRWGTYWGFSAIVTQVGPDGVHLVFRLDPHRTEPVRVEAVELLEEKTLIAKRRLGFTVDPTNDGETEVPIFLPVDTSAVRSMTHGRLKVRIGIARDGEEPSWTEGDLYAPPEGGAP